MTAQFTYLPISCRRSAFSLVEVVVAVGIFALAIVAVIGLLAPLGTSVTDVRDGDDASRVAATIQAGLQDEVNRLKQQDPAQYWTRFASYLNGTTTLYASRDGAIVGTPESMITVDGDEFNIWDTDRSGGALSVDEEMAKFFEISLTRNIDLSPPGPANDAAAGYLAFNITLRWPGYVRTGASSIQRINDPDSSEEDNAPRIAQQSVLILPAAVVR